MSASADGFILFALGGNIKSSELSPEKIQLFFRVFSRLKQNIVWKFESDEVPVEKPSNVLMIKWLPQVDLLAHSNIRLFISHCGLGGVNEARYYGVPVLGLPVYGDQLSNARMIEIEKWSKTLNIDTMTEDKLNEYIADLLSNHSYTDSAKKVSQLYRDRPLSPLDNAVYWIEYVLRYDGARHMQSVAVHLNFIQNNSLDTIAFVVAVVYVSFKLITLVMKCFARFVKRRLMRTCPSKEKKH